MSARWLAGSALAMTLALPAAGRAQGAPPVPPTTGVSATTPAETPSELKVAPAAATDVIMVDPTEAAEQAAADLEASTTLTDEDAGALEAATPSQLLKFYGFGDVGYRHFFVPGDSPWFQFLNRRPSFFVGNLNLYLDAQLSERWRTLAEVRFTYLPHGSPDTSLASALATRQDNQVADYTDFSRSQAVGGIMLERATLEYNPFTFLTVSAGHWLTPYGVWNVDHGSPTIIGVAAPFIIGAELLPASQVGFLAQGTKPLFGDYDLGYALGVSNGRVDQVPFEDLDGNKAVTARLSLTFHGWGDATLGATMYRGRSTTGVNELFFVSGKPKSRLNVVEQYDEASYAADFRWVWRGVHVQTEWLVNERHYTARGRPRGRDGGLQPDKRNLGGYVLGGYRLPFFGIMPYAKFEYSAEPQLQSLGLAEQVTVLTAGLNLRPEPRVVFKVEYARGSFTGGGPQGFAGNTLQGLDMQAAWAF